MPRYTVDEVIRRGYILKSEGPTYSQRNRGEAMHMPQYDCSSFMAVINGIVEDTGVCPATPTMRYYYTQCGYIYYPYAAVSSSLKKGDVLVWNQGDGYGNNGHTALFLGDGRILEMSGPGIIDYRSAYYKVWTQVLRNPRNGIYITHWTPTDGLGGGF